MRGRRPGRTLLVGALAAAVLTLGAVGIAAPTPPPVAAVQEAAVAPRVPPTVSLDLPYVPDGESAHRLDLFVPGGYTTPRPLVIFVHGGAWTHGSKSVLGGGSPERGEVFLQMLLRNGYAVASVEYRFSQVARFPAQLHDVKAATRFLRAEAARFHLDPDRFAAAGESAGGHLAQLLAFTADEQDLALEGTLGVTGVSSRVSALVSYYGVSDLSRVVPDRIESRCPRGEYGASSPEGKLIGGDPEARSMRAVVARANPVTYVGLTSPPSMLLHGTRDCLVPARQTARLYRLLDSFGRDVHYIALDAPHGGPAFHTTPVVSARVLAFLDRTLGVER